MNQKNNLPDHSYLVAGSRPWSRKVFDEVISGYPGIWTFVDSPKELNQEFLEKINPRFLFFFHWSWKVDPKIISRWECIGFHMTDLPYGRGGSPLQNLIHRGHKDTKLSAIRLVEDFDAGPIYLKEVLSLEGNAEEIFLRGSYLAATMTRQIIRECPEPIPQMGEPTIFNRRRPMESEIPKLNSLDALYDFIRMLDAEGYPRAYLEDGVFRYQFRKANLLGDKLVAKVEISLDKRNVN